MPDSDGEGDTHVEPSSQHPFAMLVDLETLDVDPCEEYRKCGRHDENADAYLRRKCAAEGNSCNHESTGVG